MGETNTLLVLSSEDEDSDLALSSKRSYTKAKSSSSVTRTNTRRAKKARLSSSQPRPFGEPRNAKEFRLFCEDFDQVFSSFKVPPGNGIDASGSESIRANESWIEKYKPLSLEDLAVHKKKVEEVKVWFEERLGTSKENVATHTLVMTGPAGVGKSATVRVIASHLGARLCEWNTPTPMIWQEHLHNSSTGINYTSKLDEFENFVERVRKYGVIPSSFVGESKSSVILLIDDLPLTNGKVARGRLQKSLHLLAQSTPVPTAIMMTDCVKAEPLDLTARCLEELQSCLESDGSCKVAFNPITYNSVKKTLSRICRQEQCNLTVDQIDVIAKASCGDIRHAIISLQFFCLKPSAISRFSSSSSPTQLKENTYESSAVGNGYSFQFGRDETLSLFHALGKFLHNKRKTEDVKESDEDAVLVGERLSRLPLKMDAPEKILHRSHGQARTITDFLHENVLDFLNDEAIDDAWTVASYLGDADLLLSTFNGMLSRYNDSENALQSAAASVAVRGVLFGNFHPLPSRWHAIRRPKLWQIEVSSFCNKKEMAKQRFIAYNGLSSSDVSVIATEYTPSFKWLGAYTDLETPHELVARNMGENQNFNSLTADECQISDDEIEDW